jgi:uncharacterized protein YdeI (BOF family)
MKKNIAILLASVLLATQAFAADTKVFNGQEYTSVDGTNYTLVNKAAASSTVPATISTATGFAGVSLTGWAVVGATLVYTATSINASNNHK